jgi:hypothetical protein
MNNPFEIIEARLSNIETLLLDIKHAPRDSDNQSDPDKWLNLDELISYLPDKPAKATIYGKVHSKMIPYCKQGKSLIFRKSEIDEWLNRGRIKTVAEISEEASHYLRRKGNG